MQVMRLVCAWLVVLGSALALLTAQNSNRREAASLRHPQERHLANIRQLTFGGENAEAYFSPDNRFLIFQSRPRPDACDQIYILELARGRRWRVSTGQGRTTCGFFFPDGQRVLFSSTHHADPRCPPGPNYSPRSRMPAPESPPRQAFGAGFRDSGSPGRLALKGQARGYVWMLNPTYDIFTAKLDGSDLKQLTTTPGYDAEATVSRAGRIVFTSTRDGDLEIYTMNADGSGVRRLTAQVGYDGGAVFSPDGRQIAWRAHYPTDAKEIADYQALLKENLVRPHRLELWLMDADSSNQRQLTSNGAANFGPAFHPDGQRIIFASNLADAKNCAERDGAGNFDLYLIKLDGSGVERITYDEAFDAFPMFSPDGKKLVWASNRQPEAGAPAAHNQRRPGETNIFIADWVD